MSRPFPETSKNGVHSHNALSWALEKLGSLHYLATIKLRPTTPVISTLTTTDADWVALATGLTGILKWRISELNGNDFHYAYVVEPDNNFSVGFGWVSEETAPTAIYVKRPAGTNITLKLERWSA